MKISKESCDSHLEDLHCDYSGENVAGLNFMAMKLQYRFLISHIFEVHLYTGNLHIFMSVSMCS